MKGDGIPLTPPSVLYYRVRTFLTRDWAVADAGAVAADASVLREMRLADLVQHFGQPAVVARLVQEVGCAESDGGVFVFGQIVIREHDDSRLQLGGGQCAHDPEARTLLQMQIH